MKNQNLSFGDGPHDYPEYIQPSCQDFLITDITEENLRETAKSLDVEYLGAASFPRRFAAIGNIVGGNHRLMISLVCRRQSQQEAPAVNVVFLVKTGSPVLYLSKRAMKALMGHRENVPQILYVQVHNERVTEFHLSPPGSHFEDVNLLGMDFLIKNRRSLVMNYDADTFTLQ
ncbi:hypothetical protein MP228_001100 [Amoeboaphelidium protococcarum]|nr:hypothetical protein MP228_001100 [Amoeboaphelidium protococcarum]